MRRGNVYSYKQVFELCLSLAQEGEKQKEETKRGRGHPPIYSDSLYTSLLLFRAYFQLTFRETEALLAEFFPHLPCPTFQALHWFSKRKLSIQSLEELFRRLKARLLSLLPKEEEVLFTLDTTGLPYRGKDQKLKWFRGKQTREVKGHNRFCGLIRYLRKAGLLVLEGVKVGEGYAGG